MRLAMLVLVAMFGVARAEDAPSIAVVIDRTLASDKLAAITEAINTTAKAMPAQTELAIVLAAEQPTLLGSLNAARKVSIVGVRGAARADLGAAIGMASRVLKPSHARTRRILVITDGDDLSPLGGAVEHAADGGARVSALGYQTLNRVVLKDLAARGRGRTFFVDDARALASVFEAAGKLAPPATAEQDLAFTVVIDASISGAAFEAEKETARILSEIVAPDDMLAVVLADHDGTTLVPLQRAANRMRIGATIARLRSTGGRAFLTSGLKTAHDVFQGVNASHKWVVLVTPGTGSTDGAIDAVKALHAGKVAIIVVGPPGANRSVLAEVAAAGDGQLFMAATNLGDLSKAFMSVHEAPW